jgi:hypothetical protein
MRGSAVARCRAVWIATWLVDVSARGKRRGKTKLKTATSGHRTVTAPEEPLKSSDVRDERDEEGPARRRVLCRGQCMLLLESI